jgi:DNA-binding FadR family transcriptional regulator
MDQTGQRYEDHRAIASPGPPRLRVPKTAELVANHIREQIVSGALIAGEYLPPEASLTDAFCIARPTLREAMRILETEGLIAVARGARTGAQVLRPTIDPVARHAAMHLRANRVDVADLYAAHQAIEVNAVSSLCSAPTAAALHALHQPLSALRAALAANDPAGAQVHLLGFHALLTDLAGNRTIALFAAIVRCLLADQQRRFVARNPVTPDQQRDRQSSGLAASEQLMLLIAAGDGGAASAYWHHYLASSHAVWLADGEGERVVELPLPR